MSAKLFPTLLSIAAALFLPAFATQALADGVSNALASAPAVMVADSATPSGDSAAGQPSAGATSDDHLQPKAVAPSTSAWAGSVTLGFQSDYPRQDLGNLAAVPPVMQDMVAFTSPGGHATFDWWSSTLLSTKGVYGRR